MIAENRIRGAFVWTLSFIYLILFTVKILHDSINGIDAIKFIYMSINLALLLIGIYIFRLKKLLSFWLSLIVIILGNILSSILINSTDGILSIFFPFLYFIFILYGALSRGKTTFILSVIVAGILLTGNIYLSPYEFTPQMKINYIIYIVILFVTLIVIRNYPIECLSCTIVNDSCPNKKSCSISINGINRQGVDEGGK